MCPSVRHQTRTHGFSYMCQENRAMLVAVCSSRSSSNRLELKGHDDYLDFMRSSHIHVRFGSVLHAEASQGKGWRKKKTYSRMWEVLVVHGQRVSIRVRERFKKSHSLAAHHGFWIAFLEHMCFRTSTIMWPFKLRTDNKTSFVFFFPSSVFIYFQQRLPLKAAKSGTRLQTDRPPPPED